MSKQKRHDWGHLDTFYISGPMTGLPGFNYPEFARVKSDLLDMGIDANQIINPAENHGGRTDLPRHEYLATAVLQVANATIIVLLPGWEHSEGCRLEVQIGLNNEAEFWLAGHTASLNGSDFLPVDSSEIRKRMAEAVHGDKGVNIPLTNIKTQFKDIEPPVIKEDIELEASRLVRNGERQKNYGHPRGDFDTIARLWSPILGVEVTAEKVALAMIALKLARLVSNPLHHDSKVDVIGYAICLDRLSEEV